MKLGHGAPQGFAVARIRMVHPIAFEESDDRRWASDEASKRASPAIFDGQRTGHALGRQVLHQGEEEGQIALRDTLLIKRQDVASGLQMQKKIRVLDALGDALAREKGAELVTGEKGEELLVADFRVDCHGARWAIEKEACSSPLSEASDDRSQLARQREGDILIGG